jgi:hypothetical protein
LNSSKAQQYFCVLILVSSLLEGFHHSPLILGAPSIETNTATTKKLVGLAVQNLET